MSALADPAGLATTREELVSEVVALRGALARLGRMTGAAVILMDDPVVAEAVRRATLAEAAFWAVVESVERKTLDAATALRCAALSEEFAAESAATSDGGWG